MSIVQTAVFFILIDLAQAAEFSAGSAAGRRILAKAKTVEASKFISREAQEDTWDNYYDNLSSMTINYIGCSSYDRYAGDMDGNDNSYAQQADYGQVGEDGKAWWKYQQKAQNDGLEATNLVRFTLCTGSQCSGICSGEYVLDMEEFMKVYTEWKMDHDSFYCERVRESCDCNVTTSSGSSYTWQECYTNCFEQSQSGLTYESCMEANAADGYPNVFQIQQYLQCSGIKFYNPYYMYQNNKADFDWDSYYYLGLTCEDNRDVVLKAFYDVDCSYPLKDEEVQEAMGEFNKIAYLEGAPVLAKGKCIDCGENDEASGNAADASGNNNREEQPDGATLCEMITNQDGEGKAVVCDSSRHETYGCEWIEETLPSLDGRSIFHYAQIIKKLQDKTNASERIQWVFLSLVLVLIGSIIVWAGFKFVNVGHHHVPNNRAGLLEYRRENAESTDWS